MMKKLMFLAALALSTTGAFAQSRVKTTTIQPKIGLNISTVGDLDWKAGCALGFELQHQINRKTAIAGALLYSFQGGKDDDWTWNPGYINIPITLNYYARHVNTFDFAIPVGMSYEFDNFVIDGRYNIGVTKVPKHGDGYTNVVQLTLGYKFKL